MIKNFAANERTDALIAGEIDVPIVPFARSLLYSRPTSGPRLGGQSSATVPSKLHTAPLGSRKSRLGASRDHPGFEFGHCQLLSGTAPSPT
jgi:hypothetical protein